MTDRQTYCSYQITLMKQIGAWPLETDSVPIKLLQVSFRWFTILVLFATSICLIGATLFSEDLKEVSSTVDIATLTISALYKIAFTTYRTKRFVELIEFMNAKFKKVIYNKNGDWMSVKEECKRCNLYSTLLVLSGALTIAFYCVTPLLEKEKIGEMKRGNSTVYFTVKRYPLHFWLPFNADANPMYQIIYFVQSYSLFFSAHIYLVMDSFFFTMIYQICVQMRMLCKIMLNLGNGDFDYDDGDNNELLSAVHDSNIVRLNDREIECLYRSMILADVLHAIISLSFALHETGVSDSIYDRIKMYLFLIICILHQFLNSHYGEQLLNVQEEFRESIYMSPWVHQNSRHKKYIVMMILRSQKCTILNGGKMYHLCRQSFVLFTKTMFSFYMVLRQSSE